ncbi:MAG: hypothetical protein ACI4UN_09360, partial [Muribaculaceae bacterium]
RLITLKAEVKDFDRRHRILAMMLAVLFMGYYASSTLCEHVHYVNDVMVVHSHPFGGSGHTHTAAGLQALSLFNATLHYILAEVATVAVAVTVAMVITVAATVAVATRFMGKPALRAPPVIG